MKIKFESDITDAVRGTAELVRMEKEHDEALKNVARSAGRAGRAVKSGTDQAKQGAKEAKTSFEEFGARTLSSMTALAAGIIGPAGVMMAVRSLNEELKQSLELQKGMTSAAMDLDKMAQMLAGLRGDISAGGIAGARKTIEEIATSSKISLETAGKAAYFSESVFERGSPAAKSAAQVMGMAAGVYQLDEDTMKSIGGLMVLAGADTEEKQRQVMNQVLRGANLSQVVPSEYLRGLGKPLAAVTSLGMDMSMEDLLGYYSYGIIERGGSTMRGGTDIERLLRGGALQSKAGQKFLQSMARREGLDYTKMGAMERFGFTLSTVEKMVTEGREQELVKFGEEDALLMMKMISQPARAEQRRVSSAVASATGSGEMERMFDQYQKGLVAREIEVTTARKIAEAKTGRERANVALFDEMVSGMLEQAHAQATFGEATFLGPAPEGLLKRDMMVKIIQRSLRMEMDKIIGQYESWDQWTDESKARYGKLAGLRGNIPFSLTRSPDYLNEVFKETENLSNLQNANWDQNSVYERAIGTYFKSLEQALDRNTAALEKQGGPAAVVVEE